MEKQHVIFATDTAIHNPAVHTLDADMRALHVLVSGTSASHKDALQHTLMVQDIEAGHGVCVIDTTGRFADRLLDHVPHYRAHDTSIFRGYATKKAYGFNVFRRVPEHQRPRVTAETVELFKAIWQLDYDRTPLLLDILRSTVRAVLDYEDSSFLTMYKMLADAEFRQRVVRRCIDPVARGFWLEFENWPARDKRDKPQPVLTRLRAFVSDPNLRAILGQKTAPLDIDTVIAKGQVLLVDLPEQVLGSETAMLLGSLFASRLRVALGYHSGDTPFYTYVPDCQRIHTGLCARLFGTPSYAGGVTLSTDQIGACPPDTRTALLSAQTILTFRLPPDDIRYLAPRFMLAQVENELLTLPPDRLAASHHQYDLQAINPTLKQYRQRQAVERRSCKMLAQPRGTVNRKIERSLAASFKPAKGRG